ncbi:hypothetical protein BDQ17DRAFT_1515550 [Cyathus striatus]|nr:hypothetical protein BDQ17DRAFT_1515550 [Cyathus striatus]
MIAMLFRREYDSPKTSEYQIFTGLRSFIMWTAAAGILLAFMPSAMAQAPVNDVISWPPGLLLLAAVLYAALAAPPDTLWSIEPSIGIFMGRGFPLISIPIMQKVAWVTNACHFVSRIRRATGVTNFWIGTEAIKQPTRLEVLRKVLHVLDPIIYEQSGVYDTSSWMLNSYGLIEPAANNNSCTSTNTKKLDDTDPTAEDFLYFAAVHYHAFWEWEIEIYHNEKMLFTTKGTPPASLFDIDTVAAQIIRRPASQSLIRPQADVIEGRNTTAYRLNLAKVNEDTPCCSVDFHSYASSSSKVSTSLRRLSIAYYRVISYIKRQNKQVSQGSVARAFVGQSIWIAILGGATLDSGRLTIQNLSGRRAVKNTTAGEAFTERVETILNLVREHANKRAFEDLVFSGGNSRRPAIPFLLAGLFGQIIICYFLSVGTSAGVWTSVTLGNSLFVGKLTDLHSIYWGKTASTEEPGMKMYMPGSQTLIAIATLDRTSPREGQLRPGILLNAFGLLAAILGSIFQRQTRDALGFSPFNPSPEWVVFASISLTAGLSFLIAATILAQQLREKTWFDHAELPTRWLIYSTLPFSIIVSALGLYLDLTGQFKFWPILDALTWISGIPLGMIENGRMISADHNMTHLILVNRWLMGAVASAVGSRSRST